MAPKVRHPAPDFVCRAVVNKEFKTICLKDYKGKYVVLFFWPFDFTLVCPTEIIAFSERVEEFRAIGCEVIGASADSVFSHLAWINTPRKEGGIGDMKIPLISDFNKDLSKAYDVLVESGDEIGATLRGLFIIDGEGILRQSTINDLPVGRNVDETLRLVEAFKFTDEHGEVCPAGWKKGARSINPKKSSDYFEAVNSQ
uniref:thioredoxin-dependent peroxiredoxin n=1 Tax=Albugo laibachii Nc14 TaxID=890382 RepID=F0W7Q1_9STRA|nr:peroxiredoxin2 putative [Albugo laibachii Nc14]|eukprot:CCA17152.1 peroxiredoxin2 putative [Albugo laibachii Nc14]